MDRAPDFSADWFLHAQYLWSLNPGVFGHLNLFISVWKSHIDWSTFLLPFKTDYVVWLASSWKRSSWSKIPPKLSECPQAMFTLKAQLTLIWYYCPYFTFINSIFFFKCNLSFSYEVLNQLHIWCFSKRLQSKQSCLILSKVRGWGIRIDPNTDIDTNVMQLKS